MDEYRGYLNRIEDWVKEHRQEYINDLIKLVNIKSVAQPGEGGYTMGSGCAKVLDKVLALAESYGLESENDEYYCGSAIYRGRSESEVAIVGHLDVVPEGDGWDYKPYNAVYVDSPLGGEIVGRGSSDNKGPTTAALYALRCLKELRVPLKHTVRLLMGCQEEAGMTDMPHFLEKHAGNLPKLFLVCDCPFPIHYAEKGIMEVEISTEVADGNMKAAYGGLVTNSVPDSAYIEISDRSLAEVSAALEHEDCEKIEQKGDNVRISFTGKAGHAAFPMHGTDNAVEKMTAVMSRSGLLEGDARRAVEFLAGAIKGCYGEGLGVASEDEISGKTTAVGSVIRFDGRTLTQSINIRYAVTADQEKIINGLKHTCETGGFRVSKLNNNKPMYVPLDSMGGLPRKLASISTELLDMGPLEPVVLAGGTHARKLPNAVGYGPGLGPELEAKRKRIGAAHGVNESVDVDTMLRAVKIYAATLIRIDDLIE